eukprot:gene38587-46697_t
MNGTWVEVGEVTGSSDGGFVGTEFYDHVLPVEIETPRGLQSLRLGYNNGENPFVAAQRFINQNELPQNYLQQIADWILQTPQLGETPTAAAAAAVAKKAQFSFKASGYLQFDEIPQKDKFLAKIAEFNAALSSSSPHVALRPIDLEAVTALFQ